ncbi:uncharacterized protein LOC111329126 [Stylophora pistillata]|uniref:UPAR/Ly6 domain-containing protein n=1 Tax=Stylophora pistillata TaxID=50429 RepID=A0A2B4SCQ9_STYPI|nr:uncharacterized protein LOC111329126 [Stylophora pistillata]PFX26358.1 hypothetical protein AWC38_SpisGene8990 [Stylophora pistillata]
MNLLLARAFFLCLLLPAVSSLNCYVCSSSKSWEDCTTTSHKCPAGYDRCSKVYLKAGSIESFRKYCAPKAACTPSTDFTCKHAIESSSFDCDVTCCEGDHCNSGSALFISVILFLTCGLASLWIVVKD